MVSNLNLNYVKFKLSHLNYVLTNVLTIHFMKVLTSLLWEMKKTVKILIAFFFFSPKNFL